MLNTQKSSPEGIISAYMKVFYYLNIPTVPEDGLK